MKRMQIARTGWSEAVTMSLFDCDNCGACCCTFPIFAAESDAIREPRIREEGRRLALWLVAPQWDYQLFPLPFHESCCFLDRENRCTIYATRPDVCRRFEPGSAQCQEARQQRGLPLLMPLENQKVVGD
jgi:Fe-S-cluster containining protein